MPDRSFEKTDGFIKTTRSMAPVGTCSIRGALSHAAGADLPVTRKSGAR